MGRALTDRLNKGRVFTRLFCLLVLSTAALISTVVPAFADDLVTLVIERKGEAEPISVNVSLALDNAERAKGLMYVEEMPDDQGMLFIFPTNRRASFWMRNTYIPLDIIFIRETGVIANIHSNVPPMNDTSRPSRGRVRAVLELNGGMSRQLGIKEGDRVVLSGRLLSKAK